MKGSGGLDIVELHPFTSRSLTGSFGWAGQNGMSMGVCTEILDPRKVPLGELGT